MASITIDGKEYNLDELTDSTKKLVTSLQFVQGEIVKTQAMLAVLNTAASTYSTQLKQDLDE